MQRFLAAENRTIGETNLYMCALRTSLPVFFRIKWFWLKEMLHACFYLHTRRMLLIEAMYFFLYLGKSPYQIAKKSPSTHPLGNIYGETPPKILKKIGEKTGLSKGKTYLELGSGRGKGVFFMREVFSAVSTGLDWVEPFIESSIGINNFLRIEGVHFQVQDIFQTSLPKADVVYIYSTSLSVAEFLQLAKQLISFPKGAYVATVSEPLAYYSADWKVESRFKAAYPWGKADVFIQKKVE